jgi:hypothetical protein
MARVAITVFSVGGADTRGSDICKLHQKSFFKMKMYRKVDEKERETFKILWTKQPQAKAKEIKKHMLY